MVKGLFTYADHCLLALKRCRSLDPDMFEGVIVRLRELNASVDEQYDMDTTDGRQFMTECWRITKCICKGEI